MSELLLYVAIGVGALSVAGVQLLVDAHILKWRPLGNFLGLHTQYELDRRYSLLALLVDAEYGSATYIEVRRPARFEVRVSTSGLLIRETDLP